MTVWKSAPETDPPSLDPTEYGWVRDEATKTLIPTTLPLDVALALPEVLELLRCGCSTNGRCRSQRCGCNSGQLPCTFFFACRTVVEDQTVEIHLRYIKNKSSASAEVADRNVTWYVL